MPRTRKSTRAPLKGPAARRRRQFQHFETLLNQGKLSPKDFDLCLTFAYNSGNPERDDILAWMLGMSDSEFAERRERLRAQGIIEYAPAQEPGYLIYRVRLPGEAMSPLRPPALPVLPARPVPCWIVLERGEAAHLLRESDLFPAERTLCGLAAIDAEGKPLPRLNAWPADYRRCQSCERLSKSQSPR